MTTSASNIQKPTDWQNVGIYPVPFLVAGLLASMGHAVHSAGRDYIYVHRVVGPQAIMMTYEFSIVEASHWLCTLRAPGQSAVDGVKTFLEAEYNAPVEALVKAMDEILRREDGLEKPMPIGEEIAIRIRSLTGVRKADVERTCVEVELTRDQGEKRWVIGDANGPWEADYVGEAVLCTMTLCGSTEATADLIVERFRNVIGL